MFYYVLPTLAPLFQVSLEEPGPTKKVLPFDISLSVSDRISFSSQCAKVGSCRMDVFKLEARVDTLFQSVVKTAGCVMTRNSLTFGSGEMARVAPFTMQGTSKLLDFQIPRATIFTAPEGIVFWIRAFVQCGAKASATKRPERVGIKNIRTKIYHDYQLCGIEPSNWDEIANYIAKIVPIRIRLSFTTSLEVRTDKNERISTEEAVIDCNLPDMEIVVSANCIEAFGLSRRRCALIKSFSVWIPQLSTPLLKDTDTSKFGVPSDTTRTHHVPVSPLGPIPIAIAFADVTVEIAEDLIMLIGSQIFQASEENIRKWTVDTGYYLVPYYKPVTIRLSRIRFSPAELAPVVLDVKDWEMAIGPTKDCLSFAFLGIKAWVPDTVIVPPLIYVPEPALIDLRVKRLTPLTKVFIQSDYSMQPGSWRDLKLRVPPVRGAVAPGLHATTRFIDRMLKTVNASIRPGGITPVTSPSHNASGMRKGPVKNVSVECASVFIQVVRETATIASFQLGRLELELDHSLRFTLESIDLAIGKLASITLSEISLLSNENEYMCEISRCLRQPVRVQITDNAMALLSGYVALKDAFIKAWFLSRPIPKLNSVLQMAEQAPASGGLVNMKFIFVFPTGIEFSWQVPRARSGRFFLSVPPNSLSGEAVFHGFTLFNVARKYPTLRDDVLIQWLRYPWTVGSASVNTPSSPSMAREKESWGLHEEMTSRIAEFLKTEDFSDETCFWEYLSARGLIDTPVYLQLQIQLLRTDILLGERSLFRIDHLEVKGHCHNLPTQKNSDPNASAVPKIKISYWMTWDQDEDSLALDFVPEVHVPLLLQLVGSPADAEGDAPGASPGVSASGIIDMVLDRVDFGFRLTMYGMSGRAANWVFSTSRVALFKEEDHGTGIVVAEVRDFQIAACSSPSIQSSFQHLHSRLCPHHDISPEDDEVFPFLAVRQLIVHLGLAAPSSAAISVFCNIQGARLWWSPALNRAMRVSLNRTDELAALVQRWKVRFTADLFARLGKTKKQRKTLESILEFLDWFSGGRTARLVLRCADVQANMHNVRNGVDDLFENGAYTGLTPPRSPGIPRHFQPFAEETPMQIPVARILRIDTCDCVEPMGRDDAKEFEKFLLRNPLGLEVPKIVSWSARFAHLQGSPLPPAPLALFFSPPNSRKERAVGALKFAAWRFGESESGAVRPKPRGSQLLLSSQEAVFEVVLARSKGLDLDFNASFQEIHGSVAPTALRGLIWLGQPGQTLLREVLTIRKIVFVMKSELFPLKSAQVRFYIPSVSVSADDDAFHLITDVLRNSLLYRGALIDPEVGGPARSTPQNRASGTSLFSGPVPSHKRDAIVEGLLTSLAVADANLPPVTNNISAEYIIESISVNLTHRQRCFVQLQLVAAVGKHSFAVSHPHRPMQFSFQIRDVQIAGANNRTVLQSANRSGSNLLTLRGSDRYITLNNREWQVYDTLFLSVSPIAVDVTQELIEELYLFLFPVEASHESSAVLTLGPVAGLETLDEQTSEFEVVGHKLLSDRNKKKIKRMKSAFSDTKSVISDTRSVYSDSVAPINTRREPASSAGQPVFFKFVRFSNIDSVITFKGKQFSLNSMNLTLKYYLKRRRLATWKEFLDEWGTKVGKQAFGSFVKHGFSRKKALQEIIVNKLNASHASDIDKLLFGKYAPK